MPKKPITRLTADPFGKKLLAVMQERGVDIPGLAKVFNVKPASVYDWIDHGRFGKARFGTLVEWSGRSLHWWFDVPELPRDRPVVIAEAPATYTPLSLPGIDEGKVRALKQPARRVLAAAMLGAALAQDIDIAAPPPADDAARKRRA